MRDKAAVPHFRNRVTSRPEQTFGFAAANGQNEPVGLIASEHSSVSVGPVQICVSQPRNCIIEKRS